MATNIQGTERLANLLELRNGSNVKRWHTKRTIRQQTVAEHTYGMLLILTQVFPEAPSRLYRAIVMHDLAEGDTGDIPYPAKAKSSMLRDALRHMEHEFHSRTASHVVLTEDEEHILKWCDMFELLLWCLEEIKMGNTYMKGTLVTAKNVLEKLGHPSRGAEELYTQTVAV